jgi:hypothetical protein
VYKGFFLNSRRLNRETKFDETTKNAATCLDKNKNESTEISERAVSIFQYLFKRKHD